ncbi:hypothetical protein [Candidatus Poriferisocius sp.]|uniref:hypothetical protein n=1 Tax=Candidatus Poriferisocius sp. TaxID=3101276 RepID=UPI003B5BCADA
MTAEVVILNRGAVAIAADSAATVGAPGRKIYNTANKLFPLSTVEPVAVMVYGGGSFASIPWETVIKEHRRDLASTSYGSVEEYAEALVAYLPSLVRHVSRQEQRERVVMTAWWELDMVRTSVESTALAAASAGTPLTNAQIRSEILSRVNARISHLQQIGFIDGISTAIVGREISAAIKDWPAFVDEYLNGLPTNSVIKRRARVMARASLRAAQQSPWGSGVVVTGFGTDQLFPAMSQYFVDGIVAGRVRAWRVGGVCIGKDQSAGIYPFAQEDMVATFMEGIHPDYRLALSELVDQTIGLLIDHFSGRVKGALSPAAHSQLLNEMAAAKAVIADRFQDHFRELLKANNSAPIMSIVELLPKEEIAEMAEALVNLTSFKRRVTPEAETVGGPVDVAVISKGDGLVWIRRKHYFAPELNPRYFGRDQGLRNAGIMGVRP